MNSPIRAAFAMASRSSTPMVASEAAMATGLPPKVDACAPGFQSITSALRDHRAQRHPGRNSFRHADDIRLNSSVIHGPPFSRAPHARLHFVRNQQNSVLAAQAFQALQKLRRRRNVSAFSLNWLDEDCGNFFGIHQLLEKFIFDLRQRIARTRAPGARRKLPGTYLDRAHEIRPPPARRNASAGWPCWPSAIATPWSARESSRKTR